MLAGGVFLATARTALADGKVGGTLIAAFDHDPAGFDPAKATLGMSHAVIEQVYSTLTALWTPAPTHTLTLRSSVDVLERTA